MNIVIIMSGGIGTRFGAMIPKQYNLIAGRPVIDYVIDAVEESEKTDQIVVVMDPQWISYSEKLKNSNFAFAVNGRSRLESLYNGLKLIKDRFPCEKVVIVDAVAPFITGSLIDDYFQKLNNVSAVITAQKITGGFTDYQNSRLDREKYIITQSPEGFNFELLWNNFDANFPYQETACMLPENCTREYYFGFKNNLKLTYDFELGYAEYALGNFGRLKRQNENAYFDQDILYTEGLKAFLLRNQRQLTIKWLNSIYAAMPGLIARWQITSFLPNQISRYGLVLHAKSKKYGGIILKFIPYFIGRYQRQLAAMKVLSDQFMCKMIGYDEKLHLMVLQEIANAKFACFDEFQKLACFFTAVKQNAVVFTENLKNQFTPYYFEELKGKLQAINKVPYCRQEVEKELKCAIDLYQQCFVDLKLYYIHGDLHENNILDQGNRFIGIDPNGMIAPLAFEFVRFMRNDVRNHPQFGYYDRFRMLIDAFSRFVDKKELAYAFIIDMGFCTYNSTFENEKKDQTLVDLQLIRVAKAYIDSEICQ